MIQWNERGKHQKSLLPEEVLHFLAEIFWGGDKAMGQDCQEMLWTIAYGGEGRSKNGETLQKAALRSWRCPIPESAQGHLDGAWSNLA